MSVESMLSREDVRGWGQRLVSPSLAPVPCPSACEPFCTPTSGCLFDLLEL